MINVDKNKLPKCYKTEDERTTRVSICVGVVGNPVCEQCLFNKRSVFITNGINELER